MLRRGTAATLGLTTVALLGCAVTQTPAPPRPTVLLLDLQTNKELKLAPSQSAALIEHLATLLAATESYRVVSRERLHDAQKAAPRRRRRGPARPCDLPCQAKLGEKLSASKALELHVERNLLEQCDVFVAMHDLRGQRVEARARARRGCSEEELKDALHRAVCHVVAAAQPTAAPGAAPRLTAAACVAQADFLWAERKLKAFQATKIAGAGPQLAALEQRLAEQVLELKRVYERIAQHRLERWTIAAQCRTGAIYQAYAGALAAGYRDGAVPGAVRKQGEPAVAAFQGQLAGAARDKVRPLQQKAREIFAACVKRAEELKLDCPEVAEARRLQQTLPR
jgi:hypothetical protein